MQLNNLPGQYDGLGFSTAMVTSIQSLYSYLNQNQDAGLGFTVSVSQYDTCSIKINSDRSIDIALSSADNSKPAIDFSVGSYFVATYWEISEVIAFLMTAGFNGSFEFIGANGIVHDLTDYLGYCVINYAYSIADASGLEVDATPIPIPANNIAAEILKNGGAINLKFDKDGGEYSFENLFDMPSVWSYKLADEYEGYSFSGNVLTYPETAEGTTVVVDIQITDGNDTEILFSANITYADMS